ncbi:MAG: InlB B-repeat-containing protein [Eubacterium sp.]|nr:InlB B-repeat-containing protein [Eubacterium sp.]
MKNRRGRLISFLLAAVMLAGFFPAKAQLVSAAETITTHDGDEIRAALQKDGDVSIVLDGDVTYEIDRITDRARTEIEIGGGIEFWWEGTHTEYENTWAVLGSGNKQLDLAGYRLHISVNNTIESDGDWNETLLYMADIPAGAALTVNDSSGTDSGSIMFDAYLHKPAEGALATQVSTYFNENVVYRNVFRVKGGDLIFNGGEIETRKKRQYIDPARKWDTLIGIGIGDYISQQVNCVGITIESGNVFVNGGIVSGRGYRWLYAGSLFRGAYAANEHIRASAIHAEGGNLIINDGTFKGYGDACALDVYEAADKGGIIAVRGGSFSTDTCEYILMPSGDYGSDNSNMGAARYMKGSSGPILLHADFIDWNRTMVEIDGTEYDSWETCQSLLSTGADEITVKPKTAAPLYLIDAGTGAEAAEKITWDGTSSREFRVYPDFFYEGYPWTEKYYQASAESVKQVGTTATVIIGDQVHSAGGEPVTAEKTLILDAAEAKAQLDTNGYISFDLKDFKPDTLNAGDSFLVNISYVENLMPYNGTSCTASLVHKRQLSVAIKPDASEFIITQQPQDYLGDGTAVDTTLTAKAPGATDVWWYQVWPESKLIQVSPDTGCTFDEATGVTTLNIPVGDKGSYYYCTFVNGYDKITSETVFVGNKLDYHFTGKNTDITFTEGQYGCLGLPDSFLTAFKATDIMQRSVKWYKNGTAVLTNDRIKVMEDLGGLRFESAEVSDAGVYYADVTIHVNGKPVTIKTGTYTVSVKDLVEIEEVRMIGIGELYLGDPAPSLDDIVCLDGRVKITGISMSGGTEGKPIVVPTFNITFKFQAAEGFMLPAEGVQVYMDDKPFDHAFSTSYPTYVASHTYDLQPRAGADDSDFVIDFEATSATHSINVDKNYNATGQIEENTGNTGSDFIAVKNLPEWATLDADGNLQIIGEIPETAYGQAFGFETEYKSAQTGSAQKLSGNAVIYVPKKLAYLDTAVDISLITHEHTWGTWTDCGDGTHKHTCTGCSADESASHNWGEGTVMAEPTKTADGTMQYICKDCGAVKTVPIPYETHILKKVDAVPPTCTEDGNIEYWVCEDCGVIFSDAEGENAIVNDDSVEAAAASVPAPEDDVSVETLTAYKEAVDAAIAASGGKTAIEKVIVPATGHTWGEWTVTKEATPTEDGERERICSVCKTKETETIKYNAVYYTITLNLNGGTWEGKTGTVTLSIEEGKTLTLPKPVREGYTFDYWEGSRYEAGANYVVKENHTFTAQWKQNGKTDGGSSNNNKPGTGDTNRTGLWIGLIAAAAAVAAAAGTAVKKRR